MNDPDRDFLLSLCEGYLEASMDAEDFTFDVEEAIYWYANKHHGGMGSNLYEVLSTSEFRPGPCATGPCPGSMAEVLYEHLVDSVPCR